MLPALPTARCWNCSRENPVEVLPGVRFALCKCRALFPSESNLAFAKSSREANLPERQRIVLPVV